MYHALFFSSAGLVLVTTGFPVGVCWRSCFGAHMEIKKTRHSFVGSQRSWSNVISVPVGLSRKKMEAKRRKLQRLVPWSAGTGVLAPQMNDLLHGDRDAKPSRAPHSGGSQQTSARPPATTTCGSAVQRLFMVMTRGDRMDPTRTNHATRHDGQRRGRERVHSSVENGGREK